MCSWDNRVASQERTRSSVYRACERPVEKTSRESCANLDSHSLLKAFSAALSLSLWSTCQ